MKKQKILSILVPIYNEEKSIAQVIDRVVAVQLPGWQKEIIIINDGSQDSSSKKIRQMKKKYADLKVFDHEVNKGKAAAIYTGLLHATGEYILIQDADLEYNPQDIPQLVRAIDMRKPTVVYGTRLHRLPHFRKEEKYPLFILHYFGNRFLSFVASILYGHWLTDIETGYKLFPRNVVKKMNLSAKGFAIEAELTAQLLKHRYNIIEVPIVTRPRGYSEGKKLQAWKDGPIALWQLIKHRFFRG